MVAMDVAQIGNWANLWIYFVGSFGGAAIAALAYRFINRDE